MSNLISLDLCLRKGDGRGVIVCQRYEMLHKASNFMRAFVNAVTDVRIL
jgi:hypothetical protein